VPIAGNELIAFSLLVLILPLGGIKPILVRSNEKIEES